MFEAVIFDWDGTLADTHEVIVTSFHMALKEIDCDVSSEYIERRIGIGAAETFRSILKSKKGTVNEELVRSLVQRKSQVQIQLSPNVKLFQGSKELLNVLAKKFKTGLASMNSSTAVKHLLEINNIVDCFDVILTVENVVKSKPNPEIFTKTAVALNVSIEKCVVFEDSIFGVKAAKLAGMSCIAVATGVYSAEELGKEKPDLTVKTLKDPEILPFIFSNKIL